MGTKRGVPCRKKLSRENLLYRGVPVEYLEASISDYGNKDKREFVLKYINNLHDMYEGKVCLCFYGANGTGKTLLASILVREAYRHRYSSSIVTLSRLIDLTFSANKSQEDIELLDYIRNSEFLVIDEVGKENFNKTGSNINLLERSEEHTS